MKVANKTKEKIKNKSCIRINLKPTFQNVFLATKFQYYVNFFLISNTASNIFHLLQISLETNLSCCGQNSMSGKKIGARNLA